MSFIGYLASEYHTPSHTFIRREVAALRVLGERVQPFSIQSEVGMGDEDVPAVLGQSISTHIVSLLGHLVRRPGRLLSMWAKALSHRPPGWRGLLWSQFYFVEASTLAAMLQRSNVRHLHNHFANNGATVGMLAAQLAGIDWSVTLHGISETDYPAGLLLSQKLEAAKFTACASLFMRAQAMRITDQEFWDRYQIVRCGIDLNALPILATTESKSARGPVRIVCVGRLSPEKGYGVLADALSQLSARGDHQIQITIVGDGPARETIKSDFAARGLMEATTFTGALQEKDTLETIAKADMLVLPSLMEGLPVVLMEALALQVPVIASGVAGIPELVEHDRTGLLVVPTDAPALANAIARLAGDPNLREQLAKAGRQRIVEEFTSAQSALRMQALINDGPL